MPDPTHKFETKDLGKAITNKASAGRVKFAKDDGVSVDAVIRPGGLLKKLKMDQWNDFEKPLKREFDEAVDNLEKSVAKFVAKADDELKNSAPDMYELFLKPVNIKLEHKFEEQCHRIHAALQNQLQDLLKKEKVDADAKEAKINVGFEFSILQSSSRRVISSSSASVPDVDKSKADAAKKEVTVLIGNCETLAKAADEKAESFRTKFQQLGKEFASTKKVEKSGISVLNQLSKDYKVLLDDLGKKLSEFHKAIADELLRQEKWKSEYKKVKQKSATDPNIKKSEKPINIIIETLAKLEREADSLRKEFPEKSKKQPNGFATVLNWLQHGPSSWLELQGSFSALKYIEPFLSKADKEMDDVGKKSDELSKAAAAK